jgi:hypothetical protein
MRSPEKLIGKLFSILRHPGLDNPQLFLNGENPMQFTLPTARLLPHPVSGIIETADRQTLRVEYGGTTWPAKIYDNHGQPTILFPGQFVTIIGLEDSITLLIKI